MRVLVYSHLFPNSCEPTRGVFVLEQLRALRQMGVSITVVAPVPWAPRRLNFLRRVRKYSGIPHREDIDGFPVEHPRVLSLPSGRLFSISGLLYYLCCRQLVRRRSATNKIDLIHAHTIMPDGFAAVLLGLELKLPVVCTVHGSDVSVYPLRSRATLFVTTWSLQRVEHLITVSHDLKRKIRRMLGTESAEVVPNGADTKLFRPIVKLVARARLALPADKKVILFVGNLLPVKGIEFLLDAVSRLKHTDSLLCLVGDGFLKESLVHMASRLGILSRCMFVGKKPHDEIPDWFSAADCLVLSSLSEGFPTILPEAMMCKVPIVATAVGGIPEIIKHGRTGLLVPAKDSLALAQAIDDVLNLSSQSVLAMVNRAENSVKDRLTWEANARKTMAAYQVAMSKRAEQTPAPSVSRI